MTDISLLQRTSAALSPGAEIKYPIFIQKAWNAELWDTKGQRFIDFVSGSGALNTGHCHPDIIEAIKAQAECFTHTHFQTLPYALYTELAEKLNLIAPVWQKAKTILSTTGAEAVENAVKIARSATGRQGIISFSGGYHGRTLLTLALNGQPAIKKQKFGPFPGEIFHLPFPQEILPLFAPDSDPADKFDFISAEEALAALEVFFQKTAPPEKIAGILIEPVQGQEGFWPAPAAFLQGLRQICDRYGILLIADEIQTGFARTGRLFSLEHSHVLADLVLVSKSLSGSMPLSGVIGRAEIMDRVDKGSLGGTFSGNPLACAAALAVLKIIEREKLTERAVFIGQKIREQLSLRLKVPQGQKIGFIRGQGAMIAFDCLKQDSPGRQTDPIATQKLTERAAKKGLILLKGGSDGAAIRLLPPLTVSDAVLAEGLDILDQALTETEN